MNIQWDSETYAEKFDFVHQYGQGVLELLDLKEGMTVVDLGCGNGNLTDRLSRMGADVIGLDDSAEMIRRAKKEYPALTFQQANALTFRLEKPVDGSERGRRSGRLDPDVCQASLCRDGCTGKRGNHRFRCG